MLQGPTIAAAVTSATAVKMALDKRHAQVPQLQKQVAVRATKVKAKRPEVGLRSSSTE